MDNNEIPKKNLKNLDNRGIILQISARIVDPIMNSQQFSVEFTNEEIIGDIAPDNFFANGQIELISGTFKGTKQKIVCNEGNLLTLFLPINFQAGTEIVLTRNSDAPTIHYLKTRKDEIESSISLDESIIEQAQIRIIAKKAELNIYRDLLSFLNEKKEKLLGES